MIPFGYEIVTSYLTIMKEFLIDGVLAQMYVFPIDPFNTLTGFMFGDQYEIWLTRYIGGIDGDVLLSKTVKCKFRI